MRRALVAVLLGSLALLVSPTPAFAHAEMTSSTPRNGAQLTSAPKSIIITFGEAVELETAAIVDRNGVVLPSQSVISGARLTVTPKSALAKGMFAVTWQVLSDDGHHVAGAISFTVATANTAGKPASLSLTPAVKAQISAPFVGYRTITFTSTAKSGEVLLSSPTLPGPITWQVTGNGRLAKASGVVPFPGSWGIEASLLSGQTDFVVVKGSQSFG